MTQQWHRQNPDLFRKEKNEVEAVYPNLHLFAKEAAVFVRGTFPIIGDGRVLDRYSIEIQLSKNHPKNLPIVREIAGRIPLTADRHMNPADGTACVLLPDERWRVWPCGSSLLDFIRGPVHNFFLGQSLVELGEPWPFDQWRHGADGIRDYYAELLGTEDLKIIITYLETLTLIKIKGHIICPCGSGKHLRDCHVNTVQDLAHKIPRDVAETSLIRLRQRCATKTKD